jgi:hypothetical protein
MDDMMPEYSLALHESMEMPDPRIVPLHGQTAHTPTTTTTTTTTAPTQRTQQNNNGS